MAGGQPGGRSGSGGQCGDGCRSSKWEAGSEKGTWRGSCWCGQRQLLEDVVTPDLKLQGYGTLRWAMPSEGFCDRGQRCGQVLGGVGYHEAPWGVERGPPEASVPRGGVTRDIGPFVPKVRLARPPSFPIKDANSTDMPHPSSLCVDLGTFLPTCSLCPRGHPGSSQSGRCALLFTGKGSEAEQTPTRPLCSPLLALIWGCGGKITSFLGR